MERKKKMSVTWFDRQDYMRVKSGDAMKQAVLYVKSLSENQLKIYIRGVLVQHFVETYDDSFARLSSERYIDYFMSDVKRQHEKSSHWKYMMPLLYQYITNRCTFIYHWYEKGLYGTNIYVYFLHKLCDLPVSVIDYVRKDYLLRDYTMCRPRHVLTAMYRSEKSKMKALKREYGLILRMYALMVPRMIALRGIRLFQDMWEEYSHTALLLRRREKFCQMHQALLLEMYRQLTHFELERKERVERISSLIVQYQRYYWHIILPKKFQEEFVGSYSVENKHNGDENNGDDDDEKGHCHDNSVNVDIAEKWYSLQGRKTKIQDAKQEQKEEEKSVLSSRESAEWFFDLRNVSSEERKLFVDNFRNLGGNERPRLTLYSNMIYIEPFILHETDLTVNNDFFKVCHSPGEAVDAYELLRIVTHITGDPFSWL